MPDSSTAGDCGMTIATQYRASHTRRQEYERGSDLADMSQVSVKDDEAIGRYQSAERQVLKAGGVSTDQPDRRLY